MSCLMFGLGKNRGTILVDDVIEDPDTLSISEGRSSSTGLECDQQNHDTGLLR